MGCLVVYVRDAETAKVFPLWVICTNQGYQWKLKSVSIITLGTYEVRTTSRFRHTWYTHIISNKCEWTSVHDLFTEVRGLD